MGGGCSGGGAVKDEDWEFFTDGTEDENRNLKNETLPGKGAPCMEVSSHHAGTQFLWVTDSPVCGNSFDHGIGSSV